MPLNAVIANYKQPPYYQLTLTNIHTSWHNENVNRVVTEINHIVINRIENQQFGKVSNISVKLTLAKWQNPITRKPNKTNTGLSDARKRVWMILRFACIMLLFTAPLIADGNHEGESFYHFEWNEVNYICTRIYIILMKIGNHIEFYFYKLLCHNCVNIAWIHVYLAINQIVVVSI